MKKISFCLALLVFCLSAKSQKATDYSIRAEFFPEDAQMWGYPVSPDAFIRASTEVTLSEVNKEIINFYLHGELKVDSILSNGKAITYKSDKVFYENDYSLIATKTSFKASEIASDKGLVVYYSGFLNPSRASSLSNYMHIDKYSGVYLRSYYYSIWFPVFIEPDMDDHPSNFEKVEIVLPKDFKCVVTGNLIDEKIENDKYIATWKPGFTNIFEVQCTARKFKHIKKDNVHVYHINNGQAGEKIIDFTLKVKDVFNKSFRNIPDTKPLFIMEMPKYGLISSGNVVGLTTPIFNNFENDHWSRSTVVHEMIHPYVQIPISTKNNLYALVIEGFPAFFPDYVFKRMLGDKYDLLKRMKQIETAYFKKRETGKSRRGNRLPKEKPILEITHGEIGAYKDAFVLNDRVKLFLYHLWNKMGDEKFDKFVKELFAMNKIDYVLFEKLILKYIPSYKEDLKTWLVSSKLPDSFKIKD